MLTISIVSYKNKNDLIGCINSIISTIKETEYEILVLLYLYNEKDTNELKYLYKTNKNIKFIDKNVFAGYAENHNALLRLAKGSACLILNDDTYFTDNSIDRMMEILANESYIDILSPVIYNTDGSIQLSGRRKFNFVFWLFDNLKLYNIIDAKSKFENGVGIFRTYNISGACVLIRKEVLLKLGYFDEKYFFMPEDIALSEKANRNKMGVFVDSTSKVYHINSSTTRPMFQVTIPVARLGFYLYFRDLGGYLLEFLVRVCSFTIASAKLIAWCMKYKTYTNSKGIMIRVHYNVIKYAFVYKYHTKELFIKLFKSEIKS